MSDVYDHDSILVAYFKWHYGDGLRELSIVAHNFLWFVGHFFSFKLLSKTLFTPWKRLGESYGDGFDLSVWVSALTVNTLMRVFGFITRSIIIFVGSIAYVVVGIFAVILGFVWLLAPLIVVGSAILAVTFFAI